jgi:hypothetical protein
MNRNQTTTNTMPYVPRLNWSPASDPLTCAGQPFFQSPQPSDITAGQSINHSPSTSSWLSHRVAQARSLRYFDLHHWKCIDTLVPLHFRMSATDRQHLEATNIRQPTLHGPPQDGRNAPLGYLRQPPYRPLDSSDSFHHCPEDDERPTAITAGSAGCFHLQSRSYFYWCRKDLPDVSRPSILSLQP